MCYNSASPNKEKLELTAKELGLVLDFDSEDYTHYYHISGFERPFLPVSLNIAPDKIQLARWKLLPHWVKTEEEGKKYANTLNADSTKIFNTASYKPYIQKYRGLLWVEGFFEPHQPDYQKETENYFIYQPDKKIFTLGIVYAPWTDQSTGEHYPSFSIITTDATPMMAEIHNVKKRMPLIIGENQREQWLQADSREYIESLMVPYNGPLSAHKVRRVTAAKGMNTNVPEVQMPID